MGVVFASWGIGPAFITPLLAFGLENFGWRTTFFLLAIVSSFIMFTLLVLFRNRPSDINMDAYGTLPTDEPIIGRTPPAILLKEFNSYMRKTRAYWNLSSIHFLGCVGHSMIIVWIIPIAMERGFTLLEASFIYTLMSTISIGTRFLAPVMCEKYGIRISLSSFFILQGLPILVLAYTETSFMFILMSIIFGIGWGGESGGFPIFNRKYFGQAPMGSPHGIQVLGAGLGMGLGGWMVQEGYMMAPGGFSSTQYQIKDRLVEFIGAEETEIFYDNWLSNHVRKIDIDSMKQWGFNLVRAPIHYNLFT